MLCCGVALVCAGAKAQEQPGEDPKPLSPAASASGLGNDSFLTPALPLVRPAPLNFQERCRRYRLSVYGRDASLLTVAGWAIGLSAADRYKWGRGAAGAGRQFGFGLSGSFAAKTIEFGVAAASGEDPRYFRSDLHGFVPRLRYAVIHTVVSRHAGGGNRFAASRFAGAYGAEFLSEAWYPNGLHSPGRSLTRGSREIAFDIGWNILKEFSPDIKKKLSRLRFR